MAGSEEIGEEGIAVEGLFGIVASDVLEQLHEVDPHHRLAGPRLTLDHREAAPALLNVGKEAFEDPLDGDGLIVIERLERGQLEEITVDDLGQGP